MLRSENPILWQSFVFQEGYLIYHQKNLLIFWLDRSPSGLYPYPTAPVVHQEIFLRLKILPVGFQYLNISYLDFGNCDTLPVALFQNGHSNDK